MLTRLKLTAIRDQLDSLLDTATRRKLTLLDTVKLLCEVEVARKDERRIQMASSIAAKFPYVRTLEAFEFDAQPSLDRKRPRKSARATSREVVHRADGRLGGGPASRARSRLIVHSHRPSAFLARVRPPWRNA